MQVVTLDQPFDPERLPAGTYAATSDTPAYTLLFAMVAYGMARRLGQRFLDGGRIAIGAQVPGARRNAELPSGMRTITLPEDYFADTPDDYQDWRKAWWREVIQNSVDAGATHIELGILQRDDGMFVVSCLDDGSGMTEDVLLNGFLVGRGSGKRARDQDRRRPQIDCLDPDAPKSETIGGFGVAKELIAFAWPKWTIVTNRLRVDGAGPNYSVSEAPNAIAPHGTLVEATMPHDSHTDTGEAEAVIGMSNLPGVTFTVNGQRKFARMRPGDEIKDGRFGYCAIAHYNRGAERKGMFVRVGGMWMYTKRLPDKLRGAVVIEIDRGRSRSLLAADRDRIRNYELSDWVDKLGQRIAVDVRSSLQAAEEEKEREYAGANAPSEQAVSKVLFDMPVLPALRRGIGLFDEAEAIRLARAVASTGTGPGTVGSGASEMDAEALGRLLSLLAHATPVTGERHRENIAKQLAWKPAFIVKWEKRRGTPPTRFFPETMSGPVLLLARVWSALCGYVLMLMNADRTYNIGWTFDPEVGASYYTKGRAHREYLLLNPLVTMSEGEFRVSMAKEAKVLNPHDDEQLKHLVAAAQHECAHMLMWRPEHETTGYHDEEWGQYVTRTIEKMADKWPVVKRIVRLVSAAQRKATEAHKQTEQETSARETARMLLPFLQEIDRSRESDSCERIEDVMRTNAEVIWRLLANRSSPAVSGTFCDSEHGLAVLYWGRIRGPFSADMAIVWLKELGFWVLATDDSDRTRLWEAVAHEASGRDIEIGTTIALGEYRDLLRTYRKTVEAG
jgi:hypothetical protein